MSLKYEPSSEPLHISVQVVLEDGELLTADIVYLLFLLIYSRYRF